MARKIYTEALDAALIVHLAAGGTAPAFAKANVDKGVKVPNVHFRILALRKLGLIPPSNGRRVSEPRIEKPSSNVVPTAWGDRFKEGFEGQMGRVSIVELNNTHCHFPIDQESGPVLFCGLTPDQDSKYCKYHKNRCEGRIARAAETMRDS